MSEDWTAGQVAELQKFHPSVRAGGAYQRVADAHNAALAAEREKLETKWKASMVDVTTALQNYEKENQQLREQLATLVDALKDCRRRLVNNSRQQDAIPVIDAALAKVKEQNERRSPKNTTSRVP